MSQAAVEQAIETAVRHHLAGQLAQAEAIYRQVLEQQPDHAHALHLLAVIEHQAGRRDSALELVDRAVASNPSVHDYHNTRADICRTMGRIDDALMSCQNAIALVPQYAEAWYTQGLCFQAIGRTDEAINSIQKSCQFKPDFLLAMQRLCALLEHRNDLDGAIAVHHKIVRLRPESAEALDALGVALGKKLLFAQASIALRRATELQPSNAIFHYHLGIALEQQKEYRQAEAAYRQAIALSPNFPDALFNLSSVLQHQNRCEELIPILNRLIQLEPRRVGCQINLGVALIRLGQLEEAKAASRLAITENPTSGHAHLNLALSHLKLGELSDALTYCRKAIELEPENQEYRGTLANIYLTSGDFVNGWKEYECRWQCKSFKDQRRTFTAPFWTGFDIAGKTILVHCEQGLGDAIQFARYIPLMRQRGATVLLECPKELTSLLGQLVPANGVVPANIQSNYDCHIPVMSLPLAFGTTLETVPEHVPYLMADARLVADWRQKLAPYDRGVKVGIAWAGRPEHEQDAYRSCSLEAFAPLARVSDVTFFSIQKGPAGKQAAHPPAGMKLIDLSSNLTDFSQTAALISQLDLLISVDTAPVHLAGALGKSVWTLLAFCPDFRWMLKQEDTPWYPTMRLFRQQAFGDWPGVFERVAGELARFAAGHKL